MPFKPLDRTQVRTRDLILEDGHSYDQYQDPMLLTAKNVIRDLDTYEVGVGSAVSDNTNLRVQVASLH